MAKTTNGYYISNVTESVQREGGRRSWSSTVRATWHRHHEILHNAGSLVATTGVTSLLGFGYWAVAARLYTQREVGYSSAEISAMSVLGTIGMFGMGTLLIGELPRSRSRGLVAAALLTSGFGSLVLGIGFAILAPEINTRLQAIVGTPSRAMLFVVGVVLTGVTLVADSATIGLLRGGLQLTRNIAFTGAKLLALPVAAVGLNKAFGVGITASWVAGMLLSLLIVAESLRRTGSLSLPRPDWKGLRKLGKTVMAHNWLNLSVGLPYSLIPVLVAIVVSPSASGAFYIAWMLSSFLYAIPAALSTVLFAVASSNPKALARKLRFTLSVSLLIGLPGMAALALGAHFALRLFGEKYAIEATLPLQLLVLAYLPTICEVHYVAVCRAAGKISRAAVVLTTFAALEVTAAVIGGRMDGLNGLALGILTALLFEGLLITPTVLRAAAGYGRHRGAASHSKSQNSLKKHENAYRLVTTNTQRREPGGPLGSQPRLGPPKSHSNTKA